MSEQWLYVCAAYVVTIGAVLGLLVHSYWAMRRAEARVVAEQGAGNGESLDEQSDEQVDNE